MISLWLVEKWFHRVTLLFPLRCRGLDTLLLTCVTSLNLHSAFNISLSPPPCRVGRVDGVVCSRLHSSSFVDCDLDSRYSRVPESQHFPRVGHCLIWLSPPVPLKKEAADTPWKLPRGLAHGGLISSGRCSILQIVLGNIATYQLGSFLPRWLGHLVPLSKGPLRADGSPASRPERVNVIRSRRCRGAPSLGEERMVLPGLSQRQGPSMGAPSERWSGSPSS